MKGSGILTKVITTGVILISLGFVVFAILAFPMESTQTFSMSSVQLGELYVLNKILTSNEGISTGETGVLNKTRLDDAHADGGELECVYLLDYKHYIKIDDLSNGDGWDWYFGSFGGFWEEVIEVPVVIMDGNKAIPGLASITISAQEIMVGDDVQPGNDNGLICITKAINDAWENGHSSADCKVYPSGVYTGDVHIEFESNRVVLKKSDGTPLASRVFRGDQEMLPDDTCIRQEAKRDLKITFEFGKDSGPPKVVTLEKCLCDSDD